VAEKNMTVFDKSFWVLGSDTGVGKTYVTSLLALYRQAQGKKFSISKPLSCGTYEMMGESLNDDVEGYKSIVSGIQSGDEICPWMLKEASAPWTAAQKEGISLSARAIADHVIELDKKYGLVIAEGLGGVAVPLNEKEDFLDAVKASALPVVLVVGRRLGCINHTLLSLEALEKRQIEVKKVFINELQKGDSEQLIQSCHDEISSRFGEIIEIPHIASYPMALGALEKSGIFANF
jgi:dethiobiotin synthetase